jgi:uncharacterized SAM-binding protein YcdF (DUF218 family)
MIIILRMKKIKLLIAAFLLIITVLYGSVALYVGVTLYKDNKVKSDAILILGARSMKENKYNPCLVSRVNHGVDLFKNGYATTLIFSGGYDREDNINEAETMKKIAVDRGVDPQKIILEKEATSTYENEVYTKKILEKNNLKSIVIVTESFHSPRAALIAQKLKLNYTVSPAMDSICGNQWKFLIPYFLKEPLAIITYKLQGKL